MKIEHVSKIVEAVLRTDYQSRNSDNRLYLKVLEIYSARKGISIDGMTVAQFLNILDRGDRALPGFETVRRARQKIQAEHEELQADTGTRRGRAVKKEEYEQFALM